MRRSFTKYLAVAVLAAALFSAGLQAEPVIDYRHRYMNIRLSLKLSKLVKMEKMMPRSLRREISEDYYLQIRNGLAEADSVHVKEADVAIERFDDGMLRLSFTFPKFYMVIRDVTWDDLDAAFCTYFTE